MSSTETIQTISDIPAVHASALRLYHRAKQSGPDFDDVARSVRSLSTAVKHLKFEADDADSVLNSPRGPVYYRQLTPAIEDCDFTLRQLETVLDKFENGTVQGSEQHDILALIRKKLDEQKLEVELFLDTVQLQSPVKTTASPDASGPRNLDAIKDKVDAIATRIFARKDSGFVDDENALWQHFRDELEKEGFAPEVLRKHKVRRALGTFAALSPARKTLSANVSSYSRTLQEVLRAYIRELESSSDTLDHGKPASVRGLLEREERERSNPPGRPYLSITPVSDHPPADTASPKKMLYSPEHPARPDAAELYASPPYPYESRSALVTQHSPEDDSGSHDPDSLRTLVSTQDLLALDLPTQFSGMYVTPEVMQAIQSYQSSPPNNPPEAVYHPTGSYGDPGSGPGAYTPLGASPRFVPPLPAGSDAHSYPPQPYSTSPSRASRLKPDRYGNEIPIDATWTKISRRLVSPVVLDRAGVRYEARPDFVAVLGVLSREQIQEFARQSGEIRRARYYHSRYDRSDRGSTASRRQTSVPYPVSDSETATDDEDSSWTPGSETSAETRDSRAENRARGEANHDEDKGTKSYPFIVNPPSEKEEKTSPSSTVKPKPILKNRNENRVHFGPSPYETPADGPEEVSPRRSRDSIDRDRDRDRERDRDRDRDREKRISGR